MLRRTHDEPECPPLASLGEDLLDTTPYQRRLALASPSQTPSHNLPELSRRLQPFFDAAGVKPRRVP